MRNVMLLTCLFLMALVSGTFAVKAEGFAEGSKGMNALIEEGWRVETISAAFNSDSNTQELYFLIRKGAQAAICRFEQRLDAFGNTRRTVLVPRENCLMSRP